MKAAAVTKAFALSAALACATAAGGYGAALVATSFGASIDPAWIAATSAAVSSGIGAALPLFVDEIDAQPGRSSVSAGRAALGLAAYAGIPITLALIMSVAGLTGSGSSTSMTMIASVLAVLQGTAFAGVGAGAARASHQPRVA